MSAYQHKHTGEIRSQEFSPGDDWELITAPNWVDFALVAAGCVALIVFLAWANN